MNNRRNHHKLKSNRTELLFTTSKIIEKILILKAMDIIITVREKMNRCSTSLKYLFSHLY